MRRTKHSHVPTQVQRKIERARRDAVEPFPTWEEVKGSVIRRKLLRPFYTVTVDGYGRRCIRHATRMLKGVVLLWFTPEIKTRPEVSWVDAEGRVHVQDAEGYGPFAFLRHDGGMNAPLVTPDAVSCVNEAAEDEVAWLTARACGAKGKYRSDYTGGWVYY